MSLRLALALCLLLPASALASGTVTGHVTAGGAPAGGYCVGVVNQPSVETDEDGAYELQATAGHHDVIAGPCATPESAPIPAGAPVEVVEGASVVRDIALAVGGHVSGRVTDDTGAVPTRACLQLWRRDGGG